MAQLTATPRSALADTPVSISASGLAPSQPVTLQALLTDEKGVKFEAVAFYQANEAGVVDLEQASALGGNYVGVWPMGLFCTLKPEKMFHRLLKRDVINSPFHVQINLFSSFELNPPPAMAPVATCTVERWYAAPGIERFPIKTGRVRGTLFLPAGPGPFPGVIDMFGGAGGLFEFRASLLASRGFAVLALALFAYEDLPKNLTEVDLEYYEEACKLLLQHPKVRGPGLGVIGLSKGSEIALAMYTFLEQIVAAVCINGTTAVIGAPVRFRDIHIPAAPYTMEKVRINDIGVMSTLPIFQDLEDKYQTSVIPLEKAQGHVLFVVGEDDHSINSKSLAERAIARAKQHGKNNCALLSYPGAGHLIQTPGIPFCYISTIRGKPTAWGGEAKAHAKAQEHSWMEIQKFFELHLGPAGNRSL
ncbi:acyl-coenzyme A amino acid N-acyltransferase 2-like isoform X2 [Varanus komodoensis]|uniref:Bile acid-CoA:amino acid N-acyltransferase n=2 Tax=Varanus komodoensis TaxID=61221 RepID=A0A8D2IVK4_VARKO|nr:acyl-coenzyme A amino acid N-acyltransferase 2-like isoform X2 [Varanus komodoensis]